MTIKDKPTRGFGIFFSLDDDTVSLIGKPDDEKDPRALSLLRTLAHLGYTLRDHDTHPVTVVSENCVTYRSAREKTWA